MSNFETTPTHLFGGDGDHAKDLQEKGIIPGTIESVEKNDVFPEKIIQAILVVDIRKTRELVNRVITYNPKAQLANFSGVMSTTPYDFRDSTSSMHALWGPGKTEGLMVIVASDGITDDLSSGVIGKIREQGIQIIEMTRSAHDNQFAFHQALTHTGIILHDLSSKIKISPPTKVETIADMILLNPLFPAIWQEFLGLMHAGKSLGESYLTIMNESDMNLSTPNSRAQLEGAKKWNLDIAPGSLEAISSIINDNNAIELVKIIKQSRSS